MSSSSAVPSLQEPAHADRPSRVRYLVVALATAMSFILYLDRFCLAIAGKYVKEEANLTNQQGAYLVGAFFFSYALAQVPAGWFSDRYGARVMLTIYILLWSLFTALMGLAYGALAFFWLMVFRLGCGLTQAGAYPTAGGIVAKWVPFQTRGTASAIIAVGGRIGAVAAPVLTAILIVAFVPASSPSLLGPGDFMIWQDDKSGQAESAGDRPASPWKDGQPGQEVLAQALRTGEAAPKENKTLSEPFRRRFPRNLDDTQLVDGLNDVLKRRDLLDGIAPAALPREPELLDLAGRPADSLTPDQVQRRNRLLLEGAFPEQVRKVYGNGWRPVVLVYGLAGVVIAVLFWLGFRNWPREHPACNDAEARLIEQSLPAGASRPEGKVGALPLAAMAKSFSMWMNSSAQFWTNVGWIFILNNLADYLDKVHRVPVVDRGLMTSFPIFVGMVGMFLGGRITDWAASRFGIRWGRRVPILVTRFTAAAAFFSCLLLHSAWPVVIALAIVAFSTDLGTPAMWAFCQDVGGKHVGSILGWGNMWGNFGAALSPVLLQPVLDAYGWQMGFITCGVAFILSGLCSFGIDAAEPLLPKEDEPRP